MQLKIEKIIFNNYILYIIKQTMITKLLINAKLIKLIPHAETISMAITQSTCLIIAVLSKKK